MPVNCNYKIDKDYLYCTVSGKVTIDDFRNSIIRILNSDEIPHDTNALWDLRKMDFTSITKELGDELINTRMMFPQRGTARIALVVEDSFGFGLSRVYEMLSGGLPQEMKVFMDVEEGEKWLAAVKA